MSEFKFACPVCGQHITADSTNSGTQIDCPTCFQKIVVPQAPAAGSAGLILSAAKANRPRAIVAESELRPIRRHGRLGSLVVTLVLLAIVFAGGVVVYNYRSTLFEWLQRLKF